MFPSLKVAEPHSPNPVYLPFITQLSALWDTDSGDT